MRILQTIFLLFLFAITISAQSKNVDGIVLDKESREPLVGATIAVLSTSQGTTTDLEGYFSIEIDESVEFLQVSYLGYETIKIDLNNNPQYVILLQTNNLRLDEVVVTALNLERSTKDLGYSLQALDSKEISEVKSANFVDNLGGKVAGLVVSQGATGVGSTTKVTIRGESSFSNNNPLFVVDGLPISNNTNLNFSNEAAAGFQEIDFGNGALDVNQDDVASVSVLKGPAAAALYGTRAANGVIVINTKKGSNGSPLKVEYNSSVFIDKPFKLPEFQNTYGQGNSSQFEFVDGLGGGLNDNISYSWGPQLDVGLLIPQFDSPVILANGDEVRGGDVAEHNGAQITATPFISHPDNIKDFYENGFTAINNIAISKGIEKGNYRLSFTDFRSESYIPGVDLKKKVIAARFTTNPIENLEFTLNLNYINSGSDNRPSSGYGSENINYSLVAWGPRSLNTEILKDYWQPGLEGQQQYSFNYTFFDNPYFILQENTNSFRRNRFYGTMNATYQFNEKLSLLVSAGNDNLNESRAYKRNFSTNRFRTGAYAEQRIRFRETNLNFLLNYQRKIRSIDASFSFGGNRMDQLGFSQQKEAIGLITPGVFNFSNAASPLNDFIVQSQKRINSLYAFAEFSYNNFLFLDVSARNDWSSALATPVSIANTSFLYPAFSLSYVVSQQIDLPERVSFLKLRANWAQVGNDTDPYQTQGSFVLSTPFNTDTTYTSNGVIANNNLKPEQTSAFELGADIRFWDDRLRMDLTYYNSVTKNQIISFARPISSGYNEELINGGAVRSQGVELVLGASVIRRPNFNWFSTINYSRNRSVVESLPDGSGTITLAYSRVYDNQNQTVWFQVEEGGEVGDIYGTGYLKNENGAFVIGDDGRFIADNALQKLGNYNPDFVMGFSNELSYKNWELGFLFDIRSGGEIVSRTQSLAGVGGQIIETLDRPDGGIVAVGEMNVGTAEEPIWQSNTTAISPESYYRQFYDRNHEENNTLDASFIKLRSFSLTYSFDNNRFKFLQNSRSLDVALIGRNLFALSKIKHFDPEQLAVQGNQFISGVEDMSYPTARSIGIKIGLKI